jgi:hypothetical protein
MPGTLAESSLLADVTGSLKQTRGIGRIQYWQLVCHGGRSLKLVGEAMETHFRTNQRLLWLLSPK